MPVRRLGQLGQWYDISRKQIATTSRILLPGVTVNAPAVDPTIRPTGADYIRYEDLYQSGDTVTAAMARLTTPKIITFPEGKFSCRDFATGYQAGITIPPQCKGIVGSGRGALDGTTGTVFTMEPGSSTAVAKGWIPSSTSSQPTQANLVKHYPASGINPVYRNFRVQGSAQGHVFHCMQVVGTGGTANTFEDVLLAGWDGNQGFPPGETFGLQFTGGTGRHVMRRLEVDGRRTPGGEVFGAAGLTFQSIVGATFDSCNVHHCRAACYVFFQAFDSLMVDCVSDSTVPSDKALGNGGINLERFDLIRMVRPTIIGRSGKVHITASGDQYTLNRDGVTYSAASGSLEIVDPVNNATLGNPRLYVQTWDPYNIGPYQQGASTYKYPNDAPSVHKADGTRIPYTWVLNTHYVIS